MNKKKFFLSSLICFLLTISSVFAGPMDGLWEMVILGFSVTSDYTMTIKDEMAHASYTLTNAGISCKVEEIWKISYKDDIRLGITPLSLEAEVGCPIRVLRLSEKDKIEAMGSYSLSEDNEILKIEIRANRGTWHYTYRRK